TFVSARLHRVALQLAAPSKSESPGLAGPRSVNLTPAENLSAPIFFGLKYENNHEQKRPAGPFHHRANGRPASQQPADIGRHPDISGQQAQPHLSAGPSR